jgi:glycosyltransferase involved in cell wall biosynthesis
VPPLISILIPVYNRERCIGECLRSAIDQTYDNLDIVVSDNCSTDGTWAVCESMRLRDSRIRLFRNNANLGPVRNWKRCLDEARGRLGMLLFSDDSLMPRFLERAAPFLEDPEVAFAFSAVKHGIEPERGHVLYAWGGRNERVSSYRYLRDAMVHNGALPCSPGATLFRVADLREHLTIDIPSPSMKGFADHGAGPDLLLFLRTAAGYPAVAHLAEPLAFFRDHADSISSARGKLLESAYAQARIWFGTGQADPQWLNRAFGGYWAQRMKAARRWVDPKKLDAAFLAPGTIRPHYPSALWHAMVYAAATAFAHGPEPRRYKWKRPG